MQLLMYMDERRIGALKIPNYKFQIPNKLQIPISNDQTDLVSDLEIGIYLKFGAWDLGLRSLGSCLRLLQQTTLLILFSAAAKTQFIPLGLLTTHNLLKFRLCFPPYHVSSSVQVLATCS